MLNRYIGLILVSTGCVSKNVYSLREYSGGFVPGLQPKYFFNKAVEANSVCHIPVELH
jgi:hypothetical protein